MIVNVSNGLELRILKTFSATNRIIKQKFINHQIDLAIFSHQDYVKHKHSPDTQTSIKYTYYLYQLYLHLCLHITSRIWKKTFKNSLYEECSSRMMITCILKQTLKFFSNLYHLKYILSNLGRIKPEISERKKTGKLPSSWELWNTSHVRALHMES